MKKIAIVYMTKYGHTKKYAEWLKEDLDADVFTVGSVSVPQLLSYKVVIFISGVYGDKIQIMEFVKKNCLGLNPQKLIVAAVSWYTNDSEDATPKLIEDNYPDTFKNLVPLHIINSGIDKKQITTVEKMQLVASKIAIEKKAGRSSDDINALAIIKGYADQTSKDNIDGLKKGVENLLNPPKPVEPPKPIEPPKPVAKPELIVPAPIAPMPVEIPVEEIHTQTPPAEIYSANKVDDVVPYTDESNAEAEIVDSVENAFAALKISPKNNFVDSKSQPSNENVVVTSLDDALAALSAGGIKPIGTRATTVESPKPMFVEEATIPESPVSIEKPSLDDIKASLSAIDISGIDSSITKSSDVVVDSIDTTVSNVIDEAETVLKIDLSDDEEDKSSSSFSSLRAIRNLKSMSYENSIDDNEIIDNTMDEVASKYEPVKNPEPRKNAYLEYFSKRNKTTTVEDKPAPEVNVVPEPVAEIIPEPIAEIIPEPIVSDSHMDFIDDISFEPVSEPMVTPAPVAPHVDANILDFDFDVLGNESSTANKVSDRVLNAVDALAKSRAAEDKAATELAAAEENIDDNTYDVISNSLAPLVTEDVEVSELPKNADVDYYTSPEADIVAKNHSDNAIRNFEKSNALAELADMVDMAEKQIQMERPKSNVIEDDNFLDFGIIEKDVAPVEDDDLLYSNDLDYDLDDQVAVLEDVPDKSDFDFRKLQMEIEASIEVNKKKKDKDRMRNTKLSQREVEEDATKKKGITQPSDPDVFFQRPGKDYYDSDTMPDIKFDRRRRNF